MNLDLFPKAKTLSISQPIFLKGNSNDGILLIHGFTGSPHEMRFLSKKLNEAGFTVLVPRLPGHGTSGKDFLLTKWKDWLRRVIDSYYDLSGLCDNVYVAGLSMGGVLTLTLASIFNPPKIATIAAAIKVSDWRIHLTPFLTPFFKFWNKKSNNNTYEEDEMNILANEYWSKDWIRQAYQFYKLTKITKKRLPMVKSDILILASEKDKSVPLSAAKYIYEHISSQNRKMIIFKESGHVMTDDVEKEKVAEELINWFK